MRYIPGLLVSVLFSIEVKRPSLKRTGPPPINRLVVLALRLHQLAWRHTIFFFELRDSAIA
jgi:hypothetical protein